MNAKRRIAINDPHKRIERISAQITMAANSTVTTEPVKKPKKKRFTV